MISLQRFLVSALLILSVTFVFFAQSAEATKGPKITHKVRSGSMLCLEESGWLHSTSKLSIGKA
jgi:hypothetical protein